jgi:hypothetical protein
MRIRATCHRCSKDFLFLEVYNTTRHAADRCPSCGTHLGVAGLGALLQRIEASATALDRGLRELDDREPAMTIHDDDLARQLGLTSTGALVGLAA